jgi:hypothetical protein
MTASRVDAGLSILSTTLDVDTSDSGHVEAELTNFDTFVFQSLTQQGSDVSPLGRCSVTLAT